MNNAKQIREGMEAAWERDLELVEPIKYTVRCMDCWWRSDYAFDSEDEAYREGKHHESDSDPIHGEDHCTRVSDLEP